MAKFILAIAAAFAIIAAGSAVVATVNPTPAVACPNGSC
jgi:hypothetical protein